MDPQQKQDAKYKAKSIMGIMSDKMDVAAAKLRGEEGADLDVAIIKSTLNDEVVPKEKHVRTLKIACSGNAPRMQVAYVINGLAKRLEENKASWLVTLKTLIVFHRLVREVDPSFQDEMLRFSERTGLRRCAVLRRLVVGIRTALWLNECNITCPRNWRPPPSLLLPPCLPAW